MLIAAIGALGLNVLTGYAGQVSLGHAFFLAVGAYTAAVLGGNAHLTAAIWLPAAGVTAALCGALVGPAALRLRGMYLVIVTLGLVFIGQYIWFNVPSISGGPGGRAFPPVTFGSFDFSSGQQLSLGGLVIDHNGLYYYLALIILAVAMVYVWNVSRSRPGRAMQAVREREIAAAVMGVNLARTKVSAFVISSFLAGVSGALYASYLSFVTPGQWSVLLSIQYVAAIIVGGIGTVWGPVLGSIVIFALPSVMQSLIPQSSSGGLPIDDIASIAFGRVDHRLLRAGAARGRRARHARGVAVVARPWGAWGAITRRPANPEERCTMGKVKMRQLALAGIASADRDRRRGMRDGLQRRSDQRAGAAGSRPVRGWPRRRRPSRSVS